MEPLPVAPPAAPRFPFWLRLFEPPAAAKPITDPAAVKAGYRHWQRQVLISAIIGYATYYFVRKNLSVAMPVMEQELGLSKSCLGLFITLHGVLYGVSKFANGFLGDFQ